MRSSLPFRSGIRFAFAVDDILETDVWGNYSPKNVYVGELWEKEDI